MNKNVSGQKIQLFAFDTTTNLPKTGDAANITAYVSKDHGAVTVLGDTSATEMDATNAKGVYVFDLTQAETNADELTFTAKSSTSNISITPRFITTNPPSFSAFVTPTGAAVNATQIGGQTASAAGTVTFPGTIASTTNITAGTITTVTNLTNAPTSGDFTATMKTSIGTAVAASAVASVTGNIGGNLNGSVGSLGAQAKLDVNAEADTALADVGVTTTVTGRIDAAISTRLASASYTAPLDAAGTRYAVGLASANLDTQIGTLATASNLATVATYIDTEVSSILTIANKLDTAIELDGVVYRFTTNALEQAPTGGSAPTASAIADEVQTRTIAAVTVVNGLAANSVTAAALAADAGTEIASAVRTNLTTELGQIGSIKGVTDQFTFTVPGGVDANIQYVNDAEVAGTGQTGNEWGPA